MNDSRMRVFKTTDAFAVEVYKSCHTFGQAGSGLAREMRRAALRSGGSLVAASSFEPGGVEEFRHLQTARSALSESRYYLSLARRFGLIDLKKYRALTRRQDAALKELRQILDTPIPAGPLP